MRRIEAGILLSAIGMCGGGSPAWSAPPSPAALIQAIAAASKATVTHSRWSDHPSDLHTTRPSGHVERSILGEKKVGSDWLGELAIALSAERWLTLDSLGSPEWLRDSGDDVLVYLESGANSIWLQILTVEGLLAIQDSSGFQGAFAWDHPEKIMTLLRKALPRDRDLQRLELPAPRRHDLSFARGNPPYGSSHLYHELPEVTSKVAPEYPAAALTRGIGGEVLVSALVDRDGRVAATRIMRSIPELDEAAVRAVEQFQFKPATQDGRSIAVWVTVPVRFNLH